MKSRTKIKKDILAFFLRPLSLRVEGMERATTMHRSDEKTDKARLSVQNQLNLRSVNLCIPGILSKCGAGSTWAEQRFCSFASKSDSANKCLYYNQTMDGHCDCIDAQKDAAIQFEDLFE